MTSDSSPSDARPEDRDEAAARQLEALEERLGHRWSDRSLLERAVTHRSAAHELGAADNERLEFLGDSVLGLVAAAWLLERFPDFPEGRLARRKSFLVSQQSLVGWAEELGLAAVLRLGVGEERSGGRHKPALLADTFEALLGALYLDAGLSTVERLLRPLLDAQLERRPQLAHQDVKTLLQELVQGRGESLPEYRVVAEEGPSHDRRFRVSARCGGFEAIGEGRSKKAAERAAALRLLELLEATGKGSVGP